jgi:copper homeostasis protein (lipoprotein)
MNRHIFVSTLLLAALAGCGRDSADGEATTTPAPARLAGVYAGSFPCSNCEGIATTLWIRDDGRFFLRQSYVGAADGPADAAYSFGLWSWDEQAAELVLQGRGPERRFSPVDADHLELRTASPVQHLLARDSSAPPFTDSVRLEGESAIAGDAATFSQCITGLRWPVAATGAFKELRRQHRALNASHRVALTTVQGRLTTAGEGAAAHEILVIDKVVGLRPGKGC